MTIEDPKSTDSPTLHPTQPARRPGQRWALTGLTAAVALAVGIGGGAAAMTLLRPAPEMAPLTPIAISAMPTSGLITIKGKVAEIYGNKFVLQDESGKSLIETGPAGEGGRLVAANEVLTIQGRVEDGFVHAGFLVRQDGTTEALRPPMPPHPHDGPEHLAHRLSP